jgi:hypothetical protein
MVGQAAPGCLEKMMTTIGLDPVHGTPAQNWQSSGKNCGLIGDQSAKTYAYTFL